MEIRDWLILQVLLEQKNITKTAHALYISQPALTARLRQIEDEFGIRIVDRGSKGVHFTPQGEYLARRAADVIAQFRDISEQVKDMSDNVAGRLRLGASNYFTQYQLPRLLKMFKLRYPKVEFQVTTAWSQQVVSMVHNHTIHVGFVRGDYGWQDEKCLLFEETMCIASAEEIDLSILPRLPKIEYQTDPRIKIIMDDWWRENFSGPPYVSMTVNHVDTCKSMVLNGLGWAILPSAILNDTAHLHKVNLKDKAGRPLTRRTWMFYQNAALQSSMVRSFIDFVKDMRFPG